MAERRDWLHYPPKPAFTIGHGPTDDELRPDHEAIQAMNDEIDRTPPEKGDLPDRGMADIPEEAIVAAQRAVLRHDPSEFAAEPVPYIRIILQAALPHLPSPSPEARERLREAIKSAIFKAAYHKDRDSFGTFDSWAGALADAALAALPVPPADEEWNEDPDDERPTWLHPNAEMLKGSGTMRRRPPAGVSLSLSREEAEAIYAVAESDYPSADEWDAYDEGPRARLRAALDKDRY